MSYFILVVCHNCGWKGELTIYTGELVESQHCPVCKCQKITRQWGTVGRKAQDEGIPTEKEE